MRTALALIPLAILATPAIAQPVPPPPPALQVPPQLTDPRTLDKVTNAMSNFPATPRRCSIVRAEPDVQAARALQS